MGNKDSKEMEPQTPTKARDPLPSDNLPVQEESEHQYKFPRLPSTKMYPVLAASQKAAPAEAPKATSVQCLDDDDDDDIFDTASALQAGERIGIGCDLGTCFSRVAFFNRESGRVEIIPDENGEWNIPSCVAFTKKGRLFGTKAVAHLSIDPANTVFGVSRLLGRSFDDPSVQSDIKRFPFAVVNVNNKPVIEVGFDGKRRRFTPIEIYAMILAKLKSIAEAHIGKPVKEFVLSTSLYTDEQRKALSDTGTIAGICVIRTVNASALVGLSFSLLYDKSESLSSWLIFDLGGGTLNVSILEIIDGVVWVMSTAGDAHLGGEDFSDRIIIEVLQEFVQKHCKDGTCSKRVMHEMQIQCTRAKCLLSTALEAKIEIYCEGIDFCTTITRARFEELNDDLFRATLACVERALRDANMRKDEINEVVLVGGSTRIPMVQELLQGFFNGKELTKSIDVDQVVVNGAGMQAAILTGETHDILHKTVLCDVLPLSLGVESLGGVMTVLIKRNETIPAIRTKTFTISKDRSQTDVVIRVYEGERAMTCDNNFLGQLVLAHIPPDSLIVLGEREIEVNFTVDPSFLLQVSVCDKLFGLSAKMAISNNGNRLSQMDIDRMVASERIFAQRDEALRLAATRLATQYGAAPVQQLRLCICGHENVGKTTFCRTLKGVSKPSNGRTMGIEVSHLNLNGAKFSTWDFAGQVEFYATHEIFFGLKEAIFVVMCRVDKEEDIRAAGESLEYWLRFLGSCAMRKSGQASADYTIVLLLNIGSGMDGARAQLWMRNKFEDLRLKYQGWVPLHHRFFLLDCRDGASQALAAVKSDLKVPACCRWFIETLPQLRRPQPMLSIRQLREHITTAPDYVDFPLSLMPDIITYCVAMGEVIYYPQLGPLEKHLVVINPQWLTCDLLGPILSPSVDNLRSIFQRGLKLNIDGTVSTKDLLDRIGVQLDPPQKDFIAKYLLEMQLCIPKADGRILIPALLTDESRDTAWAVDGAAVERQYMGRRLLRENELVVVPEGFFPRLQTKVHTLLAGRALPKVWRGGISLVVTSDGRLIEIVILLLLEGRAIDIWARSEKSADAGAVLRDVLDEAVRLIQDIRLERYPNVDLALCGLSPKHLREHQPLPHGYLLELLPTDTTALCYPTHPPDATLAERAVDIIGPTPITPQPQPQAAPAHAPHPTPDGFRYHVFLSHAWGQDEHGRDNHATVAQINEGLKRRKLVTWFDGERMSGFIPRAMCEGIEHSKVVVCFITKRYIHKATGPDAGDNVQLEFDHAFGKRTRSMMIAVPMETSCLTPAAWPSVVYMALGLQLYPAQFDTGSSGANNDAAFEAQLDKLAKAILDACKRPG